MSKPYIKEPCHMSWHSMKIGLDSRFCDSCEKNVIDFTTKNKSEILAYLLLNHHRKTCGRLYSSQLDFCHSDFIVTIKGLTKSSKNRNLPFYLLAVGALMLSGCGSPLNENKANQEINVKGEESLSKKENKACGSDEQIKSSANTETTISTVESHVELMGDIVMGNLVPPLSEETDGIYMFADPMPEFDGGIDSLLIYIQSHIDYPEWEAKRNIEGTVYVKFVVTADGSVKDPVVLSSVAESKNFDRVVIEMIKGMPKWKPGRMNEDKVDTYFTIPVNFELEKI